MGDLVLVTDPASPVPFRDASEITITSRDQGTIDSAPGLGNFGEEARLVRGTNGVVREAWLGGTRLSPKNVIAAELKRKYDS